MFPPGTRGRARGLPYTMDAFMLGMGMLSKNTLSQKHYQSQYSVLLPHKKGWKIWWHNNDIVISYVIIRFSDLSWLLWYLLLHFFERTSWWTGLKSKSPSSHMTKIATPPGLLHICNTVMFILLCGFNLNGLFIFIYLDFMCYGLNSLLQRTPDKKLARTRWNPILAYYTERRIHLDSR